MLYRTNLISDKEKEEFIFDANVKNDDIDTLEVAVIEAFFKKNGYIPENKVNIFLDWIVYNSRSNCTHDIESPYFSSYKGRCATCQSINSVILEKIGLNYGNFNVGDITKTDPIHALCYVDIPIKVNDKIEYKRYILDPTFRQFCIKEECRFERYFEEKRYAVRMSSPHPGYFLNLNPNGKEFASDLITNGYFEATPDNIKTYFDSFILYTTKKEDYKNKDDIGKIYSTDTSGNSYLNEINKISKIDYLPTKKGIITPLELYTSKEKKLVNRIKNIFNKKNEMDEMIKELNSINNSDNSRNKNFTN